MRKDKNLKYFSRYKRRSLIFTTQFNFAYGMTHCCLFDVNWSSIIINAFEQKEGNPEVDA